ncbi:MAG: FecR family protein [Planctomycetota bacterium]
MKGIAEQIVLAELIQKELDGCLADQEFGVLQSMLKKDAAAVDYYVKTIFASSAFSTTSIAPSVQSMEEDVDSLMESLNLMAKHEDTALAIEIPKEQPQRELIQKVVYPPREKRKISKFQLFTLAASAAAMLAFAVFVKFAPVKNSYHAVIADSFNTQWADPSKPAGTGSQLSLVDGDRWLQGGYVKLLFDSGAEVVIESPARFEVLSDNELNVSSGRAYSTVPKRAKGFTVYMPNSTVVDLGTEFGVEVHTNSSSVHMIKGEASLLPDNSLRTQKPIELTAGHGKRIARSGITTDIRVDENKFVSDISSKMEMIYRGEKAIHVGTWEKRVSVDLTADLRTDGRLIQAVNLGPKRKSATVSGISFNPLTQAGIVTGGKGIEVAEIKAKADIKFYDGPDDDLASLLEASRRLSIGKGDRGRQLAINLNDLKIGHPYRIQLIVGFPWHWCDVNCYGVNREYMYFPNELDQAKLGLVSYRWTARSSHERIDLYVPTKTGNNNVHVFGYVLHEVARN